MQFGKLNRDIYKRVTEDIVTDEVVITDNQIEHIRERYPDDYERFSGYFSEIIHASFWSKEMQGNATPAKESYFNNGQADT